MTARWLLFVCTCFLLPLQALAGSEPRLVVDAFNQTLIKAMQIEDVDERRDLIGAAVSKSFDVFTISRISLGRNWRSLADADRNEYQQLMSELIISSYTHRFDSFDDQYFTIEGDQDIASNRIKVATKLTTKKEVVTLDYQLLNTDGNWRIYDVVANGVSDLSLKRSSYDAMFKQGGLQSVTADIEKEIAKNSADTAD